MQNNARLVEDQMIDLYWYLVLVEIDNDVVEREIGDRICELVEINRKLLEQYNDRLNQYHSDTCFKPPTEPANGGRAGRPSFRIEKDHLLSLREIFLVKNKYFAWRVSQYHC